MSRTVIVLVVTVLLFALSGWQVLAFAPDQVVNPLDCTPFLSPTQRPTLAEAIESGAPLTSMTAPTQTNTFEGTLAVPETVAFVRVGSMQEARAGHVATLLSDGKVLIVGGDKERKSAEIYDPLTKSFAVTANTLCSGCFYTGSALLPDGRALVGGKYDDGLSRGHAQVYNPVSNSFSAVRPVQPNVFGHTWTPLLDGTVLVVGGSDSAEVFDPSTNAFAEVGHHTGLYPATTTRLLNGRVLVTYEYKSSPAEIYDPSSQTFSLSGQQTCNEIGSAFSSSTTATLLNSGNVLVICEDAANSRSAELYDFRQGTFSTTGDTVFPRSYQSAALLRNGKVLLVGGYEPYTGSGIRDVELYYEATGTFSAAGRLLEGRYLSQATRLLDGSVLVSGGAIAGDRATNSAEVGTYFPANVFSGQLTLRAGWVTSSNVEVNFSGRATGAPVNAGALSNDGANWGSWLAADNGLSVTTLWDFGKDGKGKRAFLRLRDANGQVANIVTGTIDVDTTPPWSQMGTLPALSPKMVQLSWSGYDSTSGVARYSVQVREVELGSWEDLLADTTTTSGLFEGTHGRTYEFRVRAVDVAGNVEDWPVSYNVRTQIDDVPPTGTLAVNNGAVASTTRAVSLKFDASDDLGKVTDLRVGSDGISFGAWTSYTQSQDYVLPDQEGLQTVYVQFRDEAGNISHPVSDNIWLDRTAGTDRLVTINDGSPWTNSTLVTLTIGAPSKTTQMQISSDGGFGGAAWQPFDTRPLWAITSLGGYTTPRTVYVRVRSADGVASAPYVDDIIYDPIAPIGSISIESISPTDVTLRLSAADPDNLSGVADMRVGVAEDFIRSGWEYYAISKTIQIVSPPLAHVEVLAQFRDGAGNESTVARADVTVLTPTPTASRTPTATSTSTPTSTPTITATLTHTPTATNTPTPQRVYLPLLLRE